MTQIDLQLQLPVSAETAYSDWLDSEKHSAFTGGLAAIQAEEGSRFVCWEGYITGSILELGPGLRILQEWRTSEFPENAESSMVEVTFTPENDTCILHLKQWNIPENQVQKYKAGWDEHYFKPMTKYYEK